MFSDDAFSIQRIESKRFINCKADKRSGVKEVIIGGIIINSIEDYHYCYIFAIDTRLNKKMHKYRSVQTKSLLTFVSLYKGYSLYLFKHTSNTNSIVYVFIIFH